tara:strand:+ start:181 stop:474 length:294 start_codon:yes stop_codon:yes gene_type:complete
MPNDKEKIIKQLLKELAGLARESIERDKQLAKLEAEVIAMRDEHLRVVTTHHGSAHALDILRQTFKLELIDGEHPADTAKRIIDVQIARLEKEQSTE